MTQEQQSGGTGAEASGSRAQSGAGSPGYEPPPGYGPPPGYPPPAGYPAPGGQAVVYASPPTNGMAVASLVLGIAGIVIPFLIPSVLALIFGYMGKGQIDRAPTPQGGRGLSIAGIVLGWIGIVWSLLIIAFYAFFFVFLFTNPEFQDAIQEGLRTPRP